MGLFSKDPEKEFQKGMDLFNAGRYMGAFTHFNNAVKIKADHAPAVFYSAETLRKAGDTHYDFILKLYSEAIRLNQTPDLAYAGRGEIYRFKKQYNEAISDYNESIRLNPNNAAAFAGRGAAYGWSEQYDQAISDCTEAIRLNPNNAVAWGERGNAYYYKSQNDKAMSDCIEAIRLNPKYSLPYEIRGELFRLKNQFDQAINDCNEAIRLGKNSSFVYGVRGASYQMKGDKDRAVSDLEKALSLYPDDWVKGELEKARAMPGPAVPSTPSSSSSSPFLGSSPSSGPYPKANPASDFIYDMSKSGDGVEISGVKRKLKDTVVIPETIEGFPVVEVGKLFTEGVWNERDFAKGGYCPITSVILPNSIKRLGPSAFAATCIKEMVIPEKVDEIPFCCFYNCPNLEKVWLPNTVYLIGHSAFTNCSRLREVNIPEALSIIDNYTFSGCSSLSNIVIPKEVTYIGVCAFQNCVNLSSIRFNGKIEYYVYDDISRNNAFIGCTKLRSMAAKKALYDSGYTDDV